MGDADGCRQDLGLIACGLASRDSLRTGAVLPLSHQDIGPWTYIHHPWPFALPFEADGDGFTKTFLGSDVLDQAADAPYTLTFVGNDLRKIDTHAAVVRDLEGNEIGIVLTCATDMAIGRHGGKIYSVASPDKPEGRDQGTELRLHQGAMHLPGARSSSWTSKRSIQVVIETDVRPDRTARKALKSFM